MNPILFETEHFIVEVPRRPLVSREEGGHLRISIRDNSVSSRTSLSPEQAKEFMRLSMVVGEALEKAMISRGVPIARINYQDMGNWAFKKGEVPVFHQHVFGRVFGVPHQPLPEAVSLPDRSSGFYEGFEPLNSDDISLIGSEMERLFLEVKYTDVSWGL